MVFGLYKFPADCARVLYDESPRRQYIKALLSLLYLLTFTAHTAKSLVSQAGSAKRRDVNTTGKSSLPQDCCLLVLTLVGVISLSYAGPLQCCSKKDGFCRTESRMTVHPRDLPRLYKNSTGPVCQPDLTMRDIPPPAMWTWTDTEQIQSVARGGSWRPKDCVPWQRVAILVPYRDREIQLIQFLKILHPLLQRQQIQYRIFLIEQRYGQVFNRGKLRNVGFLEASKMDSFDCFIFHDVDTLPETEDNLYLCDVTPRHVSPAVNELRYCVPTTNIFGGVVAFTEQQYRKVNGYANVYWGWGAEDDDISARILDSNMKKSQPPIEIGRFRMSLHKKDAPNPRRRDLLYTWRNRWRKDGVSSLAAEGYKVVWTKELPLYTQIMVNIGSPPKTIDGLVTGGKVSPSWYYRFTEC